MTKVRPMPAAPSTKGARTRSRVKSSVAALLNRKSYAKITMADVCAEANITVGGFYFHFKSHEEVVRELVAEFIGALGTRLNGPVEGSIEAGLHALCTTTAELFAGEPGVARAFCQLIRSDRFEAERWRRAYDKAATRLATLFLEGGRVENARDAPFLAHALITTILTELTRIYVYRDKSDRPGRFEDKAVQIEALCRRMMADGSSLDSVRGSKAKAGRARAPRADGEQQGRGARTRHRIRQAFLELLDSQAYDEIGVVDICARAGVTVGGFYFHFKRKEDLLAERIQEHSERYWVAMHEALTATRGFDAVLAASRVCVQSYSAAPGLVRCFNDLALNDRTYADLWAQNAALWSARLHDRLQPAEESPAEVRSAYNMLGVIDALLYRLFIERDKGLVAAAGGLDDLPTALAIIWYRALQAPSRTAAPTNRAQPATGRGKRPPDRSAGGQGA